MRFILCDDDREMLDVLKAYTQQWLSEHRLEAELTDLFSYSPYCTAANDYSFVIKELFNL